MEAFFAWCRRHRGGVTGAGVGLAVGLAIVILGFWRGVFLAACVWAGWVIGTRLDAHESLADLLKRLLPPGD